MAVAGDLERWLARTNARPLPRSRHLRLFAVAMATLAGWLAGTVLGGLLLLPLADFDRDGALLAWEVAAMISTLGCVLAFPLALVWLALWLRPGSAVLRVEVAPGFGAACGAALALVLSIPALMTLTGSALLLVHLGLGALVGATTWTAYVLLARRLAAHQAGDLPPG